MCSPCWRLARLSFCALALAGDPIMAQTAALPASFDLRAIDGRSYVGPVRNQGPFGTCYSFAANAAAESTFNRATGRSGEAAADFSESFIVWSLSEHYGDHFGIDGADYDYMELQALTDHGVCDETVFPYVGTDPGPDNRHWDAPRIQFTSWHRLPAYDVETMKRALATHGALDVAIEVDEPFDAHAGGPFRNKINAVDYPPLDYYASSNHAVAVVGWDDAPPEGGDGVWIVRNSWGPEWGEDGYIRMGYHASRISLAATYLVYGEWKGANFTTRLTEDTIADATDSGGLATSFGFYAWGGNDASLVNEAKVAAGLERTSGDVLAHGLFLWGGERASLDNRQGVRTRVVATDGLATAYGLCLQGHALQNSGTVRVRAENIGAARATAYGVRFLSFDRSGFFVNSGLIEAQAYGESAWSVGAQIDDAATAENSGDISVFGTTGATGLMACGVGEVRNGGRIRAWSDSGSSYGLSQNGGRLINPTGALIEAHCDEGGAVGLDATATAVLNNGTISGDSSSLRYSTLAGTGTFVGDLELSDCHVSPGNGAIGRLGVEGDLTCRDGLTMQIEIGDGGYDRLSVDGTATLEGGGALEIVPVGYAPAGDYAFIAATTASGSFPDVSAPPLFSGSVSAGDGGFVLTLTRHSYADFGARRGLIPLGVALDRVRPLATGGVAAMLNLIDNYAEGAAIGAAVDQLQPAINAGASAIVLQGAHRAGAQLATHSRAFPAGGVHGSGSAWFGAVGERARHGAADGFRAIDEESDGGVAGVDFLLGERYTVGAAFANGSQTLNERASTDRARIDSDRGFLHARWDERPGSPGWYATARLGLGFSRIETWRRVDFLATGVNGSHRTWDGSLAVGGGRDFRFRRWTFRPFLDTEYVCLDEHAYTERGSSGAELAFVRRRTESLLAGVGLAVAARLEVSGIALQPEVHVRQAHDFKGGADGLRAAFAGGGTFTAPGRRLPRDRSELGCAVRARLRDGVAIAAYFTRTDFDRSSDYADTFGGQFQAAF